MSQPVNRLRQTRYPGVVRKAEGKWVLRLTVTNRTGVDLDALAGSPGGSLRFFRRTWFDKFTLTSTDKRGKHQNHL